MTIRGATDANITNDCIPNDNERFIIKAAAYDKDVETPEEKEAFEAMASDVACSSVGEVIDTAPQQFESLSKPEWKPKSGQDVYIAQINTLAGIKEQRYYVREYWCNSGHQNEYLNCGILFPTKEEAERKTKAMLGIPVETPEQREERERLEVAYDLFRTHAQGGYQSEPCSFDLWKTSHENVNGWLAVLDKTGYRKETK